jgi:uracil-DNA glycosylase
MSVNSLNLVDQLIAGLAATVLPDDDVTNQYAADGSPGNATRCDNLHRAVTAALAAGPALLLVGEAPGYNGARRTGVPFTSERLLLAGVDPPGVFGSARGYALATDDGRISAEQTATLVWRELQALNLLALGWNAFPFHPHRPATPRSNRTPRSRELQQGLPFLEQACALAPGVPVIAMGNVAARALGMLGIAHTRVRHPAQGGARLFAAQLRAAMGKTDPLDPPD